MNTQQAYNVWSESYDSMRNRTRDIEAIALRKSIKHAERLDILEIGCGTGKNTEWLQTIANQLIAVDFSEEMLSKAKQKISADNIEFRQFDLRETWDFSDKRFVLITCSLALEHIENIDFIFAEAFRCLRNNGLFYIGELHPFKQYAGTKARFETEGGKFELECFVHNLSDFFTAAKNNGFDYVEIKELFDDEDKTQIPKLLMMIFQAKKL